MLLVLPVALVALGLALLALGLRGRLINTHPHCRKCKFDLHGLQVAAVCPECGADLNKRIAQQVGKRQRRPILVTAGICITLIAIASLTTLSLLNAHPSAWNRFKPVPLLTLQATHAADSASDSAFTELQQRLTTGKLSVAQTRAIVAHALDIQRDRARQWRHGWGDFVEAARASGVVSDDNWARYAFQSVILKPRTRSSMNIGEPYAMEFDHELRTAQSTFLSMGAQALTPYPDQINAQTNYLIHFVNRARGLPWMAASLSGSAHWVQSGKDSPWAQPPPTHTGIQQLIVPVIVSVGHKQNVNVKRPPKWLVDHNTASKRKGGASVADHLRTGGIGIAKWCEFIEVTVQVNPTPIQQVTLRSSAASPAMLDACRSIQVLLNRDEYSKLEYCSIGAPGFPEPVAFDLLWRRPSGEIVKLCEIVSEGPFDTSWPNVHSPLNEQFTAACRATLKADLLLRPNPAAALAHVSITSIHGTEIILEDHPASSGAYDY